MRIRVLLGFALSLFLQAPFAFAASNYLLEIEGIPGESADARLPGSIELSTFSIGVSSTLSSTTGGGSGAGKAVFQDIYFTKPIDKSSPLLYLNCASGKFLRKAILHVRKSGSTSDYYTITLTDVLITSVQSSGNTSTPLPTESFSLNYSKIEFSYSPQKADGSLGTPIKTGWDVKANVEIRPAP